MGSTYTVHNDTEHDVYISHGAQKWWKDDVLVRLVERSGGNSSFNPSTGLADKTCLRPNGGKYVVKCTLSLVNSVYLVKIVKDRRNRQLRVYKGDRTVWSGATANSNKDYYVSRCDNWELAESYDDMELD